MSIYKRTSYLMKTTSDKTENSQCHCCDFINNNNNYEKIVIYCLQQKQ